MFADNVQSYSTVEPAIDLTALTPLAFAVLIRGDDPPKPPAHGRPGEARLTAGLPSPAIRSGA